MGHHIDRGKIITRRQVAEALSLEIEYLAQQFQALKDTDEHYSEKAAQIDAAILEREECLKDILGLTGDIWHGSA